MPDLVIEKIAYFLSINWLQLQNFMQALPATKRFPAMGRMLTVAKNVPPPPCPFGRGEIITEKNIFFGIND